MICDGLKQGTFERLPQLLNLFCTFLDRSDDVIVERFQQVRGILVGYEKATSATAYIAGG